MPESRVKSIHDAAYLALVECLRDERVTAGLTQADLANRVGADQSYVSKYERAERRLDVIEVRTICRALGLSLTEFVRKFEQKLKEGGST
jgi:transcriptional regulator with XRE-family HTH domain